MSFVRALVDIRTYLKSKVSLIRSLNMSSSSPTSPVVTVNGCGPTASYRMSERMETSVLSNRRSVAWSLANEACEKDDPATFEEALKMTPEDKLDELYRHVLRKAMDTSAVYSEMSRSQSHRHDHGT